MRVLLLAMLWCSSPAWAEDDELIRGGSSPTVSTEQTLEVPTLAEGFHPGALHWEGKGPVRNANGRRVSPMKFALAVEDFETTRQIRRQRLTLKLGTGALGLGVGGVGLAIGGVGVIGLLAFMDGFFWVLTWGAYEPVFIGPWMTDAFLILAEMGKYSGFVVLGSLPVIAVGAVLAIPTRDIREWYTPDELNERISTHNAALAAARGPTLGIGPRTLAVSWSW